NQAKCAVKFIRTYLGRIDKRYEEVGGLLYYMLRHGLTHKSSPKRLKFNDNNILGFKFSDTKQREKHLIVTNSSEEFRLMFSITLFYIDLLAAIDLYCDDMSHDKQLKDDYVEAWTKLKEPENETELRRGDYIEDADFAFIENQISSLSADSD
ncbi:hypothetical protein ACFLYB_07340, partial [Chloroflexota bacterium]